MSKIKIMEFLPYIKDFLSDFLLILNEMSPYLLLGLLFAGLLKVFLPESFIDKYLKKKNTASVVNATILGIPLPLCSCGVLPTGISLHKNGASKGATTAFLTATPQTGVDSILVTYAMLGLPMAIIRPMVALVSGIVGGVLANRVTKNETVVEEETSFSCTSADKKKSFFEKIGEALKYAFFTFLSDIAKWLVIGTLIAAFISVALPEDFFAEHISKGALGILLILVASVPLYICATSSVPIAAILMSKGISAGAILVFLMAGPATNVASFTLIGKTLGKKTLISYLIGIIGTAVAFGIFIDAFLPEQWFANTHFMEVHSHNVSSWFQTLCTILLSGLIIYIYIHKFLNKRKPMETVKNANAYSVPDMTCNHCKKSIENAFNANEKVSEIHVNLEQKIVQISGEITENEVEKTLKELGFTYKGKV
ncbi:MAG: permease [Flavobacteriaceae bacterium]|nr:permease [Flavobacteriaceae bacterium]